MITDLIEISGAVAAVTVAALVIRRVLRYAGGSGIEDVADATRELHAVGPRPVRLDVDAWTREYDRQQRGRR